VAHVKGVAFIVEAIGKHINSPEYKIAEAADAYDAQRNITINDAVRYFYTLGGRKAVDFTASNNRIASNFFHRLTNQRAAYSLGNGVTFDVEGVKERLGDKFDTRLFTAGLNALKHGVCFGFWNVDKLHVFPLTQFVPMWDETDGSLRAGIRFWCLDRKNKPTYAVLYEEDGYTRLCSQRGTTGLALEVTEEKRAYRQTIQHTDAGGDEVIGEENYSALPIVPLYGNRQHQSALVGMRAAIDSYDLIQSGFANDLADCAQIYWIIGNALGMDDADVQQFMDRLRINHIAVADTDNSSVTPHTQEIPYSAREAYLSRIASSIYRDYGAFNPEDVAAGQITATQINAAYQPMDEEADAFEYEIIEFVQQILALQGLEGTPQFRRNRISNQQEQVQMIISEADYLDDETVLDLLPNITPDMKEMILARRDVENAERLSNSHETAQNGPETASDTEAE
jgi:hypothetical protein